MDQSPRARGPTGTAPLSLEASLEEENRQVLAKLGGTRSRSPAPKVSRNRTPPPYRSMLDVDNSAPRHGSIAGIGVGITNPRNQRKPSKRLDPGDPSTWTSPAKPPSPDSPRTSFTNSSPGIGIGKGLPKIQLDSRSDFEQKYNFDIASMPLSGGGARPREGSNSSVKADSSDRRGSKEMKSPPRAPRTSPPQVTLLNPGSPPTKAKTLSDSGGDDARRRLSNKSNSFSTVTDESEDTSTRVMADDDGDEDALAESSSEEDQGQDSDSDEESPEAQRGRKREKEEETATKSEGNDKLAPQSQGVRSLIEPILSPSLPHEKSHDVHPPSSFGRSGPSAADFRDDDDLESDIQKAKNLGMSISPLDDTVADRHVRMIIRGAWSKFQDENENNNNSAPRLYLACTDLSTEASYAMEWTVGTMLRDGDTLLAIYAIEDESAPKEPEGNSQVMAESAKAAHDASNAMETLTRRTTNKDIQPVSTKFVPAIDAPTLTGSTNLQNLTKKEIERLKALDEITANFLKLVRKTPLQIRCMIEVIHCKSPKHLILNAIDELEPTLCVVGTRGRSSLKGVLLGSFSNYLVTKSSVPVMVARKRLKKPGHGKVNSSSIRLSNNLTNSLMPRARRSLTQARID